MSSNKYDPAQVNRLKLEITERSEKLLKHAKFMAAIEVRSWVNVAKRTHQWKNRTERLTENFHGFVSTGSDIGHPVSPNKFYIVLAHNAVDPRNNEAYGFYIETKIYDGQAPYGTLHEGSPLWQYLKSSGMDKLYRRL